MIPCCGVWVLTGNRFAAWEIISIIFAIFCYFCLLNSECDLGVHVRGHSSILQIWWGWPVTSHVVSLSLCVSLCKWDNHLIHQALCTCTPSESEIMWMIYPQQFTERKRNIWVTEKLNSFVIWFLHPPCFYCTQDIPSLRIKTDKTSRHSKHFPNRLKYSKSAIWLIGASEYYEFQQGGWDYHIHIALHLHRAICHNEQPTCTSRCLVTTRNQLLTSAHCGAHLPPEERRKLINFDHLGLLFLNSSLGFNKIVTASLLLYLILFFASWQLGKVFRGVYTGDLFPLIRHVLWWIQGLSERRRGGGEEVAVRVGVGVNPLVFFCSSLFSTFCLSLFLSLPSLFLETSHSRESGPACSRRLGLSSSRLLLLSAVYDIKT